LVGPFFALRGGETVVGMELYAFVASLLRVGVLPRPRVSLRSFLKTAPLPLFLAGATPPTPPLKAPPFNEVFQHGGPTFRGNLFPFVFICIMCGAVAGFHALFASGTTPKTINKESDIRPLGYGPILLKSAVRAVSPTPSASSGP